MIRGGARFRAAVLAAGLSVVAAAVVAPASQSSSAATAPITTTQANLTSAVSAPPSARAPAVPAGTDALATHKIDDEVQVGATMFAVGSFTSAPPVDCTTH